MKTGDILVNDELTKTQVFQAACWVVLAVLFLLAVGLWGSDAARRRDEYHRLVNPTEQSLPAPAERAFHGGPDGGGYGR